MHQPVQPKSLSWWGEVDNSLIFQHSPSRGGSLRPQTWNRSKQKLFYLITLSRIRTQDLWLWYHIELTQKLKLMGRGGQFTYIPTISIDELLLLEYHVINDKSSMYAFKSKITWLCELYFKEPRAMSSWSHVQISFTNYAINKDHAIHFIAPNISG